MGELSGLAPGCRRRGRAGCPMSTYDSLNELTGEQNPLSGEEQPKGVFADLLTKSVRITRDPPSSNILFKLFYGS